MDEFEVSLSRNEMHFILFLISSMYDEWQGEALPKSLKEFFPKYQQLLALFNGGCFLHGVFVEYSELPFNFAEESFWFPGE